MQFMHRCIALAEQGRGKVGNGAMVGAVLVRDGAVIAEGFHEGFGKAHAERQLLQKFDQNIRSSDVLYVNLEPCCHHGKTPPCTDIILERGIKTIVYGMRDPDPRVSGKGIEQLQSNGVTVIGPILQSECELLNRGFNSVRTKGRPYITLKRAQTRDGRVANDDGSPLAITSAEQDIHSHTHLRAMHDAILVGIGTIIKDNPRLDARLDSKKRDLHPYRIILDPQLRIPLESVIATDDYRHRTIIVHSPIVTQEMEAAKVELEQRGVALFEVPVIDGIFDWDQLWDALTTPKDNHHGLTSILVEGGRKTWEVFERAGMVDDEVILSGPI